METGLLVLLYFVLTWAIGVLIFIKETDTLRKKEEILPMAIFAIGAPWWIPVALLYTGGSKI